MKPIIRVGYNLTIRIVTLIIFMLFISNSQIYSNSKEDSLSSILKSCSSKDSVIVYSALANINLSNNPDQSIELGRKTLIIAERLNDNKFRSIAYTNIGKGFEFKNNLDLALSYYKDASLLTELEDKDELANLFNNIGIVFYKMKEFDSALTYYNLSLNIKNNNGDEKQRAKTIMNIASLYLRIKNYTKAKYNFELLLEIEKKLGDKKQIAYIYNYLGFLNLKLNKYDLTIENYLKELKIREELNDKSNIDITLTNIGKIYFLMNKNKKAIEYYKRALKIARAQDNAQSIAKYLSNIANVYYESKDYKKALEYYKQSLEINKKNSNANNINNPKALYGKAILLNNLGLVYKNLGEYDKALKYCKLSIDIKEKLSDISQIFYPLTSIAEINLKLGNYDEAIESLNKALKIATKNNNISQMKNVRYLLYEVYSTSGDYYNALNNHKLFTNLKDSILNKTTNKIISEMEVKFETAKKEQENATLRHTNEIQRNYFIIMSALILIILLVTISRYRSKQKANKLLTSKNIQIQQQHKELEYMFSKLQTKEENLREANATKDKFFSIIAHDLKNPLQAITLSSDFLINKYKYMDGESLVSLISSINKAGKHLETLLENLLLWARTQNGKIAFKPTTVDISNIVNENIKLMKMNSEKKKIVINSEIPTQTMAYIDNNMINTVIRNLISNAVKFTKENGFINIAIQDRGKLFWEVNIADTGVGISEEDILKLFRIDIHYTTVGTLKESGTGLGLILCKEFIEINGGKIWVESKIGEGSIFKFTIPKTIKQEYQNDPKDNFRVLHVN